MAALRKLQELPSCSGHCPVSVTVISAAVNVTMNDRGTVQGINLMSDYFEIACHCCFSPAFAVSLHFHLL